MTDRDAYSVHSVSVMTDTYRRCHVYWLAVMTQGDACSSFQFCSVTLITLRYCTCQFSNINANYIQYVSYKVYSVTVLTDKYSMCQFIDSNDIEYQLLSGSNEIQAYIEYVSGVY
ncbi:hypothetical protein CHS0354_031131 [Potamilus streckersoni]|uniref:Uncharacterized protein n=1 Tax=Potamilus streckersoni TaxID=2493646 RepID=A0AAE0TD06_9BIVA|nr:hypothetical protein CHS0354_031131 [Potamilus streckersoni]